ncbi:hypothetical protein DV737_g5092, partial [Chaetothyriales sp. CBS 132003]
MSGTATGGVRNLRAIYENKSASDQSTSPPSRNRSSSGSVASAGSRAVSSVRTSFVAVDTPAAPTQTRQGHEARRLSDVGKMAEAREEHSNGAAAASDAAPISPHQTAHPIEGGLGTILKGSSFEGIGENETGRQAEANGVVSRAAAMVERIKCTDKSVPPPTVDLKTTATAQPVKPPHPKYVSPRRVVATANTPTSTSAPGNRLAVRGGPAKILGVMESAKEARVAREAARQEQTSKSPDAADGQPESQPQQAQPSTKAPSRRLPLRGGAAKILAVTESAKEAHAQPPPSGRLPSAASATTAARESRKAAAVEPTQKPGARSRLSVPAKLPSAATAKTAASTAKSETAASTAKSETAASTAKSETAASTAKSETAASTAKSETAASTAKSETGPSSKVRGSTSRVSLVARPARVPSAATAVTASTLAKKTSRASLSNGDHGKSRPSAAKPDESFLARMSRPTVASAQKQQCLSRMSKLSRSLLRPMACLTVLLRLLPPAMAMA